MNITCASPEDSSALEVHQYFIHRLSVPWLRHPITLHSASLSWIINQPPEINSLKRQSQHKLSCLSGQPVLDEYSSFQTEQSVLCCYTRVVFLLKFVSVWIMNLRNGQFWNGEFWCSPVDWISLFVNLSPFSEWPVYWPILWSVDAVILCCIFGVKSISVVLWAGLPVVASTCRLDRMDSRVKVRWALDTLTTKDSRVSVQLSTWRLGKGEIVSNEQCRLRIDWLNCSVCAMFSRVGPRRRLTGPWVDVDQIYIYMP